MVEVYYYIPKEEVEKCCRVRFEAVRVFRQGSGYRKHQAKCISALLNPKDDMEKYRSESLRCVKLELLRSIALWLTNICMKLVLTIQR